MSNKILITAFLCLSLLTACLPFKDDQPPFVMGGGSGGQAGKKIAKGADFDVSIDIVVIRPVKNVKMKIIVPKEVEVRKYYIDTMTDRKKGWDKTDGPFPSNEANEYVWEGDLAPDGKNSWLEEYSGERRVKGKEILLLLKSKTEGKEWSSPIKAKIELDYEKPKEPIPGANPSQFKCGHYSRSFTWNYTDWGK